jgi:outer membrane lipoprotein SlyB
VRSARGGLGGVVQTGHRDIEAAKEALSDAAIDPALKKRLAAYLASPEGVALRNRVMEAKAESMPGKLAGIDDAQRVFDAARAANTPKNVAAKSAEILGPERFRDASMMRLKKYAGRVAPPFIGSAIGGAIGGSEGAMGGALAGSIASAALGSPGTALANYMRDPSVMLRMSKAGPALLGSQGPTKAAANALTEEEDRKRIANYLKAKYQGLMGD